MKISELAFVILSQLQRRSQSIESILDNDRISKETRKKLIDVVIDINNWIGLLEKIIEEGDKLNKNEK